MKNSNSTLFKKVFLLFISITFLACSNSSNSPEVKKNTNQEIFVVGNFSSTFGKELETRLKNKSAAYSENSTKTIIINNCKDSLSADEAKLKQVFWHILNGKSVVIVEPTTNDFLFFSLAFTTFESVTMTNDEKSRYADEINSFSNEFIEAFGAATQGISSSGTSEAGARVPCEAIAIKSCSVFVIKDIDATPETKTKISSNEDDESSSFTEETEKDYSANIENAQDITENEVFDFSNQYIEAVDYLVDWLDEPSTNESREYETAKSVLSKSPGVDMFDISRMANAKEEFFIVDEMKPANVPGNNSTVQVSVKVWPFCDIENQKEYYVIRTRAIANNQNLGYKNDYNGKNRVGWLYPYMGSLYVENSMDGATITEEWEPKNASGSTNYTSGVSVSFNCGGNIGISGSGPNAGIQCSRGVTWSNSESRSIPDISTSVDNHTVQTPRLQQYTSWKFNAAPVSVGWQNGFTKELKSKGAKSIQYSQAVFDTWAVYVVPCSQINTENVHLWTKVLVLTCAARGESIFRPIITNKYENKFYYKWSDRSVDMFIVRPNSSKGKYIMAFENNDNKTTEQINAINTSLKQVSSNYNTENIDYYAQKSNKLDDAAATTFNKAMHDFEVGKNTIRNKGITGQYTFYIQNMTTGTKVAEKTITFE